MQALKIVGLAILAAVLYGIVHDQVTARICIEYFTVAHPRLIASESPTVLGLFWGVVATWWVGLILGIALAVSARAGRRAPVSARELVRPLGKLLLVLALAAVVAGVAAWLAADTILPLVEDHVRRIPPGQRARFLAAAGAHNASYAASFVGGIVLCVRTFRNRKRP